MNAARLEHKTVNTMRVTKHKSTSPPHRKYLFEKPSTDKITSYQLTQQSPSARAFQTTATKKTKPKEQ